MTVATLLCVAVAVTLVAVLVVRARRILRAEQSAHEARGAALVEVNRAQAGLMGDDEYVRLGRELVEEAERFLAGWAA